ncbi:chitin deacetylase [Phlyctochytrium planicorne]|nr:chitin deacetylase [Phlyctochytrium planicorne]
MHSIGYLATLAAASAAVFANLASAACPDLNFPECIAVPHSGGELKIPLPPLYPEWTNTWTTNNVDPKRIDPDYPIVDIPPSNTTLWTFGQPTAVNGYPPWDYRNRATELCSCRDGMWALTIDDGPSTQTRSYLDLLDSAKAKATFFFIGGNVARYPDIVREVDRRGYSIGLHGWSHRRMTSLTNDEIVSEIVHSSMAVYKAIGKVPRYFRPAYGDIDDRVRSILVAFGMRASIWNVLPNDTAIPAEVPPPSPSSTSTFTNTLRSTSSPPPLSTTSVSASTNTTISTQWTLDDATRVIQNVLRNGSQPDLSYVPLSPGSYLTPSSTLQDLQLVDPYPSAAPPYPGFISLHHEPNLSQYELLKRTINLVDAHNRNASNKLYGWRAMESCDAEAYNNGGQAYFLDGEPMMEWIKGVKLTKSKGADVTTVTPPKNAAGKVSGVVGVWFSLGVLVSLLVMA